MPRRPPTYKPSWLKPIPKKVDPFYQTPRWRQVSKEVLQAAGHRCSVEGCQRKATQVDHKVPVKQGGAPFDKSNLRPLCWNHHSSKTATEDGGFGNRKQVGREVRPAQTPAQMAQADATAIGPTPAQSQPSNWVGIA
jgi:5-methylcytosine-specific restriction protein A